MKKYVDKDRLQEFANKLTQKYKSIFATKNDIGTPLVASLAADMTDTSKIYVYVGSESGYTSGNWYYYNGTAWVSGGIYNSTAFNADTTLLLPGAAADAKTTGDKIAELTSAFKSELCVDASYTPNITKGEYIAFADGTNKTANKYARTALFYGKDNRNAIELDDDTYEYAIAYYDESGSLDGTGYMGHSEYKTGFQYIPYNTALFGVSFRRVDQTSLSTADITAISAALKAYRITDTTLTLSNIAADAATTGNNIATRRSEANEYTVRVSEELYSERLDVGSIYAGGINSTGGTNNGSAFDALRCKTGFISIPSSVRVVSGLSDYRWTVYLYSSALHSRGTHSGMAKAGYSDADIAVFTSYTAEDKYVRVSFERKDGAEMTTDITDPTSDYSIILAALSIYAIPSTETEIPIEEYYQEEMQATIESVRDCQTEPCLVMPLVTDIHYASDSTAGDAYLFTKETAANISRFAEEVKCDGIICLGDIHDGGYGTTAIPTSSDDAEDVSAMLLNRMREVGLPFYYSMGNHDDCRYFVPYMTMAQIYSTYMSQSDKDVIFDTEYHGLNYYKDFPQFGVRLIEFDTNRAPTASEAGKYGVAQETRDFLTSALASMNENYIAFIITHAPIISDLLTEDASAITWSNETKQVITSSGKTAVVLTGHTHYDISTVNPFLHVVTAANKNTLRDTDNTNIATKGTETGKVYVRELDSGTKDLWDVVVLRPFSRVIDFIRFGSGVNRRFHITPIAPTTVETELSGTITWSTSDASVATVSNGAITGVGTGRCAVVATDETGNMENWIVEN